MSISIPLMNHSAVPVTASGILTHVEISAASAIAISSADSEAQNRTAADVSLGADRATSSPDATAWANVVLDWYGMSISSGLWPYFWINAASKSSIGTAAYV
jgi:hypothetical protein